MKIIKKRIRNVEQYTSLFAHGPLIPLSGGSQPMAEAHSPRAVTDCLTRKTSWRPP